jgi:hypothetical protein
MTANWFREHSSLFQSIVEKFSGKIVCIFSVVSFYKLSESRKGLN